VRRDQLQVGKFVATAKPGERVEVKMEAISVITISEAATRLGISTSEMEAIVKSGKVKSLTAGWTVVVPIDEVQKLRS
jgi:plasmid maintenance system antidote protein VapI